VHIVALSDGPVEKREKERELFKGLPEAMLKVGECEKDGERMRPMTEVPFYSSPIRSELVIIKCLD